MTPRVGPFEIVRELGRGGMGVVSLGRDTRLDRDVAIKALPAEMAADPVRLERFEREARLLAGLNHPNVAGIHGVEEQDGHRYLILEFVDGESLADRLDRGPLPVDEAIEVAVQIAAAVEAAHEAGVVHRDLKPGNIMVTADGAVKVLDFGLARTDEPAGSSSGSGVTGGGTLGERRDISQAETMPATPAPTHASTIEGSILGTAAYMSPEQARGRRVDKRTDIWSFGVVLYELLAGASPFRGETVSDSIGAILHKNPDLAALPPNTPPRVRRVLERCLDRDRSLRYRDIGDARLDLLRPEPDDGLAADATAAVERRAFGPAAVAAAAIIALTAGAGLTWVLGPPATAIPGDLAASAAGGSAGAAAAPLHRIQTDILLPGDRRLAHAFTPSIAISPDGMTLAFPAGVPEGEGYARTQFTGSLMIRRLGDPEPVPVAGAESAQQPTFSPDGTRLAYVRGDGLRNVIEVIPVTGGRPVRIAEAATPVFGLHWSDDGRIIAGGAGGLSSVPEDGGTLTALTTVNPDDDVMMHSFPHALPGGRGILYTVHPLSRNLDQFTLTVLDPATGESRTVLESAGNAQYAGGRLVIARGGGLHTARFDLDTLALMDDPRPLGMDVVQSTAGPNTVTQNSGGQFAISSDGTLAFAPGPEWPAFTCEVGWMDRDGTFTAFDLPPREYAAPRVDATGRRVLASNFRSASSAVWLHDLERDLTQQVHRGAEVLWSAWGPGPGDITVNDSVDGRPRVGWRPLRGSGALTVIDPPEGVPSVLAAEWSRDGRFLLGVTLSPATGAELATWSEADGWTFLTDTPGISEAWPSFSPDGRWIAYVAMSASGTSELFIRPFGREGAPELVTDARSLNPLWSPDGSELFFWSVIEPDADGGEDDGDGDGDGEDAARRRWIMSVSIAETPEGLDIGRAQRLFDATAMQLMSPIGSWDIGPDGRFLMSTKPTDEQFDAAIAEFFPQRIRVVQHWAVGLDAAAGD